MKKQHQEKWIPCRVYPGMFSDERIVEVGGRSFYVSADSLRNVDGDRGEVHVTIVQVDGQTWAVMPTSTSESVPLGA